MIAPNLPSHEEINEEFVELLPELTSRFHHRFRFCAPEAREERVAEAIALAWHTYLSARMKGKTVAVASLAWYVGRAVDAGQKVAGVSSLDALADGALVRGRRLPAATTRCPAARSSGWPFCHQSITERMEPGSQRD